MGRAAQAKDDLLCDRPGCQSAVSEDFGPGAVGGKDSRDAEALDWEVVTSIVERLRDQRADASANNPVLDRHNVSRLAGEVDENGWYRRGPQWADNG